MEEQSGSRKSLFAKQFAKSEEKDFGILPRMRPIIRGEDGDIDEDMIDDDSLSFCPTLITGEGLNDGDANQSAAAMAEIHKIHAENVEKLSSMSEKEILEEQAKLQQMLDPSILKFLQERRKQQQSTSTTKDNSLLGEDDEGIDTMNLVDDGTAGESQEKSKVEKDVEGLVGMANDILGTNISEKWLHMDQVEPEKLEWMKDLPNVKKSGTSEQARFDFNGNVLIGAEDIPEYVGLHHHGDEPERAGYTLEELFLLSRSNFLQQRVLAINTLARIIKKDRCGTYRGHLDQDLLPLLLQAGLPFLLRWSLDDSTDSQIAASVSCFNAMLVSKQDETVADLLCFGWYRGKELPCLCPQEMKDSEGGSNNLPDVDVVKHDLIKGLLQMRFLPRLRYILEVCHPASPVVLDILEILTRISRHSTEAAHCVAKCPRLLETILVQFVPSSWKARERSVATTDLYGHPLAEALKVFRVLCCAGKHLADTLITKYGLITKILRFITVPAEQMMLDTTEALQLAAESLTIWSICISYGLSCENLSNVYPHILTQVQGLASLPVYDQPQASTSCACALVDLVEAVTHVAGNKAELRAQLTTRFSAKDNHPGCMDASHLPPSPIDWSHVTGLLPLIGHCVRLFKDQFVSIEERIAKEESFLLMSRIFNLLASFYEKLSTQPFYSPVECLEEIESFLMNEICVPILESKTLSILLVRMRDYTSYFTRETSAADPSRIPNLPDYGRCAGQSSCSNQPDIPRCLHRGTPFPFLLSFARLAMVITSCHKGLANKFLPFVTCDTIVEYLKLNSTPGQNNGETGCYFIKVEQHFQYFLIKLFYNILLQSDIMDGELTALYHTTSLLLFSRLFPGDEFYAHDLMSLVLFNAALFHESKDECATTIASNLSEMGIESSAAMKDVPSNKQKSFSRGELLSEAYKDLLSIRSTFISSFAQMRHALAKSRAHSLHQPQNITSFLLPLVDGTMLPADWMFLPLVDLHNTAVKSELLSKPQQDRLTSASGSIVKRTLQWVLLLEEWRPVVLHKVTTTAKVVRLMCTFLTGSDLFLDNLIHNYLKSLLHIYTHSSQLAPLDFNSAIPGITSFYDLFISFVTQYEAVSFGDKLFSSFLILPLQQRYNNMFRKAVWNDHTGVFRSFGLTFDDLTIPVEYFLFPSESSFEILTLQLRALATGALRQNWSSIFYLIAVHHLSSYIFTKPENLNSFNQKLKLMNQVLLLQNQDVRNDVILYHKPSSDHPKGFQVFSALPPTRELLLRYKNEPEEAWGVWNQTA
ncbi:RNA polymerase II-associated protein 1-like [Dendronephthya gigantea]|uniref:RNA polymerase II-associated protein 1-like n=1 Tax=Dendronephthya gigantea TaxID=151771 RepID=UPI00106D86A7|nr:RNA polymerase II-associated protein 1-like [Dendronephthya gigantea]